MKATYLVCFLLASCGGDPLPKPDIENYPESEWLSRSATMSTQELYDVYRYHASLKPPYYTGFANILGSRGRDSINIWLNDIEAGGRPDMSRFLFVEPIVEATLRFGGYDLCKDQPQLTRASRLLTREYGSEKAAVTQLEGACAAGRNAASK